MTKRALLTAEDAKRLAKAASESGCAFVVNPSAGTVTIIPDGHSLKNNLVDTDGHEPPLSLDSWRKARENKGARRA